MRYLLIILSFVSFNLSHTLPNDFTIKNLSFDNKKKLFKKHKESPIAIILLNNIVPTSGYNRIHQWNRGFQIFGVKCVIFQSIRNSYIKNLSNPNPVINVMFPFYLLSESTSPIGRAMLSLIILETIDLFIQTKKYNKNLDSKIFGKKDKKLSYLLLPTSDGAYLNLSYKF